ncbi:helix-turn-helix domain-containing protein [Ligilactobacillus salivarius]
MNKIRELRKERKLTLKQVSKDTNIPISTLSSYEKGDRQPKIDKISTLAKYFDVSVAYLQGVSSEENERYIDEIHNFSDLINKLLLGMANSIQSEENVKNLKKHNLTYRDITLIKQGILLSSELVNNFEKEYTFFKGSYVNLKDIADIIVNVLRTTEIKIDDEDNKILNNTSDETTDKD